MKEYYVGITTGPIIETLCLASRPVSLWCASAMFSWLTEDICNKVIDIGGHVISPYYNAKKEDNDHYSVTAEGLGKYHDRIIFRIESENTETISSNVDEIIANAKSALAGAIVSEKLATAVGQSEETLNDIIRNYLQVRYVICEKSDEMKKNCILHLSPYLDAAELCPEFYVDQSLQPIMTLFEGDNDDKHNELVKLCFGIGKNKFSLLDESGNVRDLPSIAASVQKSDRKIFNYYAVVQADGDNMGRLLQTLNSDDDVEKFSKICLDYTTEAAKMINAFGGMTIYAGGDDLLFISPLENKNGNTIFQLCSEINAVFQKFFKEAYEENVPTLSFGISVNYKKFPLYEALNDALEMLHAAKKVKKDDEEKNKTAVRIRKSSGQSTKFRYTNGGKIYEKLNNILILQADQIVLHSMLYKIALYRPVLAVALANGKDLEQTFNNLFDSEYHETVKDYIETIRTALAEIYAIVKKDKNKDYSLEIIFDHSMNSEEEIAIDLLYSLLRTARFFSEKKGER